jgi:diaminopimelate decarboxylase
MIPPQKLPTLTARLEPWVNTLISHKSALDAAIKKYGSPIHVHCSTPFLDNIEVFKKTLDDAGVAGKIYYACKANACSYFGKIASSAGLGIDVSSLHELKDALTQGFPGNEIILTAAAKPLELLKEALRCDACIVLDNLHELNNLKDLSFNTTPEVMIRLSNFSFQTGIKVSRFGFGINKIDAILKSLGNLKLRGFQFHLDGYSLEERVRAIEETLPLFALAREYGQSPNRLDIGGGFPIKYLDNSHEFESFLNEIILAQKGERGTLTFRNDCLSVTQQKGEITSPGLYPVASELAKENFLERILSSQLSHGKSIAEHLRAADIELFIEPGRALLDGAGVTISSISHDKVLENGSRFVTLNMNQTQCRAVSREFCVDPIWLGSISQSLQPGFLTGDTCMETDLIFRRMIDIPSPLPADALVLIPNTAGYQMHLFQNSGHRGNLPLNLIWSSDQALTPDNLGLKAI